MTAIWLQIAWKEWCEQVWKMIAVAAIALSVEGYLLVNYPGDNWPALMASWCLLPGAVFIAMGVAAGERTAGGLEFLRSLPVALWKWAVARLLAGAVALLLPLAAIVLLQLMAGSPKKVDGPALSQVVPVAALFCLSVYLWTVAVGVDRSSELRAGVAAVCLFVGWSALALAVFSLVTFFAPSLWRLYDIVILFGPLGASRLMEPGPTERHFAPWQIYLPQLLVLTGTALWSVRRYGRLSASDNGSPAATSPDRAAPTALRPCRRSPLAAMIWKEYRESRPVCLAGLAIVAALVLPTMVGLAWDQGSQVFAEATVTIFLLGAIMAMVLGLGGHAGDLESGVWQFWRSRPITPMR
ncbi:MAG TPA: hypothetical protein VG125_17580, partial [Pirellulales bacterium]|nr:hypothetical protein [Pirellulales bacterium]